MSFDEWWSANVHRMFCDGIHVSEQAAQEAWNAASEGHEATKESLRKAVHKSMAYREALKRATVTGCKKTGRCASRQVNQNYCPHCRPIMNVLFDPTCEGEV